MADDVVSVDLEGGAVSLLDLVGDVTDQHAASLLLGIGQAALASLVEALMLDADGVPVGVHLAALDDGGGSLAGLRSADALAPRGLGDGDQLGDLSLLRDDKVARSLSPLVAEPRDGAGIRTLGDVADDHIRLPAIARALVGA